jgi:hypothetical protein
MAMMLLLLGTARVIAPDVRILPVLDTEPVDVYEHLMQAILVVESAGDTMAYNPLENAYGPFQIRPIRLADFNMRTGKKYVMKDCYTLKVSKEVFRYYAVKIGPDFESIARRWNGSGAKTIEYWGKVRTVLEKMEKNKPLQFPG